MPLSPIDSKDAGLRNEKLILSLLRQHKHLSQAEICKMASLGSSTSSYIVGRLRDKGLIVEERGESLKRGAKPVVLSINPTGRFAIGAEITPTHLAIGLFDYNSTLIEKCNVLLASDLEPDSIAEKLNINLRGLLSKHEIKMDKLSGVGVALSGSVAKDGTVELSSPMSWKNVPLGKILTEQLNTNVEVCTTRVRLLAESSLESKDEFSNVLYFNIADGVGSHAIIDGHLLHGATNRTGEIGHIVIDPSGPVCGCGHKGCLEVFISGPAIAKTILKATKSGVKTALSNSVNSGDLPETIVSKWGDAIKSGDAYSIGLCKEIALQFSSIASVAINCYDPNLIIMAGYVSEQCYSYIEEAIREKIATNVYHNETRDIQIRPAKISQDSLIIGAAKVILQRDSM